MFKKKKWLVVLALLISVFYLSNSKLTVKADTQTATVLNIHYFRYDADYAHWGLWLWQGTGSGQDYVLNPATNDSFGNVLSITLSGTNIDQAPSVGILIKQAGWVAKDIASDRFIDMSQPDANGVVNAYFVQGDTRIGYSVGDPNGPDKSDKIMSGYFTNTTTIAFSFTSPITSSDVSVYKNDVQVSTSNITFTNLSGQVTLSEAVDVTANYEIRVHFPTDVNSTFSVAYNGLYDTQAFKDAFTYTGTDLGAVYTKTATTFKLWAPISSAVQVCLYDTGANSATQTNGDDTATCTDMSKQDKGVWSVQMNGDISGKYYTYKVTNGSITNEVVDPYAESTGVNGLRGMVVDLDATDPEGFDPSDRPDGIINATDAIIYELHVRDMTSSNTWNGNSAWRGKFLGLTQEGTTYNGVTTGLDHIKELGVNYVQILPMFDFGAVNETRLNDPTYQKGTNMIFNWGYMPINYNSPEGSYSTDPYDGFTRVNEMKQMIQSFHDNGIRVIMDVVYNHTGLSDDSNFNEIIPGYYHRMTSTGTYSNGSGTGNEVSSERPMTQKFILDSLKYWVNEYGIDGFRFDLMALEDTATMTAVSDQLHAIDPTILVYGEPWTGGTSTLPASEMTDKVNLESVSGVGAFNDDTRDGIKGSAGDATSGGYIQGVFSNLDRVKYGIVGGIDYTGLPNYNVWHGEPTKTVNYVSCHDNNTLYDKLKGSMAGADYQTLKYLQEQANAIVLTSQGIVFIQEGDDFMRTKGGDNNSNESPDSVNQMDWSLKAQNIDVFNYYKGMIALRKAHPAFRMATADDINSNLHFLSSDAGVIEYTIDDYANNDTWGSILVVHNANTMFKSVTLPAGEWNLVANQKQTGTETIKTVSNKYVINSHETLVFYQGERVIDPTNNEKSPLTTYLIIGGAALGVLAIGAISLILFKRKS